MHLVVCQCKDAKCRPQGHQGLIYRPHPVVCPLQDPDLGPHHLDPEACPLQDQLVCPQQDPQALCPHHQAREDTKDSQAIQEHRATILRPLAPEVCPLQDLAVLCPLIRLLGVCHRPGLPLVQERNIPAAHLGRQRHKGPWLLHLGRRNSILTRCQAR